MHAIEVLLWYHINLKHTDPVIIRFWGWEYLWTSVQHSREISHSLPSHLRHVTFIPRNSLSSVLPSDNPCSLFHKRHYLILQIQWQFHQTIHVSYTSNLFLAKKQVRCAKHSTNSNIEAQSQSLHLSWWTFV
jgi:hypothetical protein